jgi:hypothetical protein
MRRKLIQALEGAMRHACPSLAREEIRAELNETTVLTRLVTAEFQTPFYGTTADQRHLGGERRRGVCERERNCEDIGALSGQKRR